VADKGAARKILNPYVTGVLMLVDIWEVSKRNGLMLTGLVLIFNI